ncbi:endonuclease domain-containing protein [Geodermatophilus sp. YIM 151500]|uniref:endonuclease domain-containing protein n=1 Tax=Geodermatophilus sp. YIM 151500 TaxID=2984531 RepID=UPI00398C9843
MTKRCPSCRKTKPAANFGRNRSLGDGLSFYCLECNRAKSNTHYRKRRQAMGKTVRDVSWVPDGFRWCPVCRKAVRHEKYMRSSVTSSGFGSRCKPCHNAANSEYYFHRRYKLTKNQVAEMRAAQDDQCAICRESAPQHLDHDHATGETRQLLCQRCNHGLGLSATIHCSCMRPPITSPSIVSGQ